MARMFGTDGVRGIAGSELTIELAMKLGQAGAYVLTKERIDGRNLFGWRERNLCRGGSDTGDRLSDTET